MILKQYKKYVLLSALLMLFSTQAFGAPDMSFEPIREQISDCTSLPCTFTHDGMVVKVYGNLSQGKTEASLNTFVNVDGRLFGSLKLIVLRGYNDVTYKGKVSRESNNQYNLSSLEFPFDTKVDMGLAPGAPLPTMEIKDAVLHSMLLTLMDLTGNALGPPACGDIERGPLDCSGPLEGFAVGIPFPVSTSKELAKCCMKHDAGFSNGGHPSCFEKVHNELVKCAIDAIPWTSYLWTKGILFFMGWADGAFVVNDDDCRCIWDVDDALGDRIFGTPHDKVTIENTVCCEQEEEECEGECKVTASFRGKDVLSWKGKCGPAPNCEGPDLKPKKPDSKLNCGNKKIEAGEQCDPPGQACNLTVRFPFGSFGIVKGMCNDACECLFKTK